MAVFFPDKLLKEANHDWNIAGTTKTAGQNTGASVDVRSDGGGFWMASLNSIQFWDRTDTLLWRAIRQLCNGGVTPIVVPRNDVAFAPTPVGAITTPLPFSDGTTFSDGSAFASSVINVSAAADAAQRATSMLLNLTYCAPLQGGEAFAINHPTWGWRMYEIATVDSNGSVAAVTFNPPLREAVTAGTQIEFDKPRCTMKLIDSKAMDLNVTTWPFSLASVKFVEAKFS